MYIFASFFSLFSLMLFLFFYSLSCRILHHVFLLTLFSPIKVSHFILLSFGTLQSHSSYHSCLGFFYHVSPHSLLLNSLFFSLPSLHSPLLSPHSSLPSALTSHLLFSSHSLFLSSLLLIFTFPSPHSSLLSSSLLTLPSLTLLLTPLHSPISSLLSPLSLTSPHLSPVLLTSLTSPLLLTSPFSIFTYSPLSLHLLPSLTHLSPFPLTSPHSSPLSTHLTSLLPPLPSLPHPLSPHLTSPPPPSPPGLANHDLQGHERRE